MHQPQQKDTFIAVNGRQFLGLRNTFALVSVEQSDYFHTLTPQKPLRFRMKITHDQPAQGSGATVSVLSPLLSSHIHSYPRHFVLLVNSPYGLTEN